MWETLPIQREAGPSYTMIDRDFEYPTSPNIRVSKWKDIDQDTKNWAFSVWTKTFQMKRNFMGEDDLLIWMDGVSTLVAKHGNWIGETKSFYAVYVSCNYVKPENRGQGISSQMILTMANESTKIWGPIPFLFEVNTVPHGLKNVQPFLRFSYVWVPFINITEKPLWKPVDLSSISKFHGFHVDCKEGYKAFTYDGQIILLDALNDIIYYTDPFSLPTFDALSLSGAWCRFFTPWGNTHIFLHNMYFNSLPLMKEYLLA